MKCFDSREYRFMEAVSGLAYANPFLPERIELEKLALGNAFQADAANAWSKAAVWDRERPNIISLADEVERQAQRFRERLVDGAAASPDELQLYQDLIQYLLYYRVADDLDQLILVPDRRTRVVKCWASLCDAVEFFFHIPGAGFSAWPETSHLLACFFQIRRAFHHIFDFVLGSSEPAIRLRASIWQSIFTHDMRRYQRALFSRMSDIPTLITGPSGTGKELVARAIGLSRYIPFDSERRKFSEDYGESFQPIHLASLTPTLIESELFGHCKGAFTGAVSERVGRLETCSSCGSVFLDEIGEISGEIQVKLLRVFQSREFSRVGESNARRFEGKVITATNRDLASEAAGGSFREDLFYRLCADTIVTPSLRVQLNDSPDDLEQLVRFIAMRVAGDESESVSVEAIEWIRRSLCDDYVWPGNIRELEQCVRNIMVHGAYTPPMAQADALSPAEVLQTRIESGSMTADELLQHYCSLLYSKVGSYEKAASLLKLDRRTVKSKVDAYRAAQDNVQRR